MFSRIRKMLNRSGVLCLLVVCAMLLVGGGFERANATNYTISSSLDSTAGAGTCTLRKALQNQFDWANGNAASEAACAASTGNDVITLTTGVNLDANATLPAIAGTVQITGGQTIDGSANGNSFIFTIADVNGHVGSLDLESITLTGANQSAVRLNNNTSLSMNVGTFSNNSFGDGGAISGQGTISLNLVHFTDNSATSGSGGAISLSNSGGSSSITNSWFDGNTANNSGGGIYYSGASSGPLTITNTLFGGVSANTSHAASGATNGGGAIFSSASDNSSQVSIVNCSFINNTVDGTNGRGGAIFNAISGPLPMVVLHSIFGVDGLLTKNSVTDGMGGAIYSRGNIVILDSTFIGNDAGTGQGGAIASDAPVPNITDPWPLLADLAGYLVPWPVSIVIPSWPADTGAIVGNSTIYNNSADQGGAVYSFGQGTNREIALINVTLDSNTANAASGGGGIYNTGLGTVRLSNAIVSNNTANGSGDNCNGTNPAVVNTTSNLQWPNNTCAAAATITSGDPKLNSPSINLPDILTLTMSLQAGSAASNAGDNTTCANPPIFNLDQRSLVVAIRPDGAPNCDIGAYESDMEAPTLSKGFAPGTITSGDTSTLTITLGNASSVDATLTALFTDTLPAGMTVATPGNLGGTCPGVATAADGSGTITYASGAAIPAGGCTIIVDVTSSTPGTSTNTVAADALQTDLGNNAAQATADLVIIALPTVAKGFVPGTIQSGGTSTLTITLGNANAGAATVTALFTDTLPAGMTVATPGNLGGTCPGVATAADGSGTITYASGATIPAGGCTIIVDVTSSTLGTSTNTVAADALQTDLGNNAAQATADLVINTLPTVAKGFAPGTITSGGTSTLTITLGNANAGAATLTALFTDTLPAGMTVATPGNLGGTCPGVATAADGSGTVTYASGATIPAGGCTIIVDVTSSTVGTSTNTVAANALQTDLGNNAAQATADLVIIALPTVAKGFAPGTIQSGGTSTLTITLGNVNAGAATLTALFTDTLPAGMTVANPNNLGGTCPGSKTAIAGGNTITYANGATIPAGGCTIIVDVTSSTVGTSTNTVAANTLQTDLGNNASPATADLVINAATVAPTITKAFGVATIALNGSTSLTFTINNPNGATALTGVAFTDTLPAGLVVSTPNGLSGSCGGGTITATQGTGSISLSGAALPAAGSCNFAVNVTGTTPGTKNNTTGAITSTESGAGGTASDSLVVGTASPTITTASPLPSGTLGVAYSRTFAATDGTAPYTNWAVTAGALPDGLLLNPATGEVSGMPTTPGTFNFTIQVTDSAAVTDTKAFSLTINAASTSATPVPTVNEWGMIIFMTLAALGSMYYLRRRRG